VEHYEICKELENHQERIVKLELKEATLFERVDNLIRSQDNLTSWVKTLVVAIVLSLAALFINSLI